MQKKTWRQVLHTSPKPLQLPVAHDVITAKLIQQAGYPAFQIGGFALVGACLGLPDADLAQIGEMIPWIEDITNVSEVPVMVDGSNGGSDPKMIARTVMSLESAGASAIFLEDQTHPKKCGHMADKHIVEPNQMVEFLKVALESLKSKDTFLMARTDAYAVEALAGVIDRGHRYLEAGAHGLYVEGVDDEADIAEVGKEFKDVPLAMSILEGHGKTPWMKPGDLAEMGYDMILYPTTLFFRSLQAMRIGLYALKRGEPTPEGVGLTMEEYAELVNLSHWQELESRDG